MTPPETRRNKEEIMETATSGGHGTGNLSLERENYNATSVIDNGLY